MKHNPTCAPAVRSRVPLRAAGLVLLAGVCTLSAATRQSANYAIEAEVLDNGGGVQTAGAVHHVGSLGGDFGAAPGTGGTFTILHGYIGQVSDATNVADLVFVTQSTLPNGTNGSPYSVILQATNGSPPIAFAVISGALPPELTLSGSGLLTGTPTAVGTFNFTVRATDALNATADRAFSLTVMAWTGTSYVWTGSAGSDWWNAGNWSPNGVPGPDDDATINSGSVAWSGEVSVRTLNFNGGELSGSATFYGSLNWSNGTFSADLTVPAGSRLNILGSASHHWTGSLVNHGRVVWEGSGNLNAGFHFYNQPDGVWEIRGDGTAFSYDTGVFNTGLIVKSAGTGTTTLGPWQNGYGLQSSGTLRVESGTVKVVGAGHLFSGPTNIVFAESGASAVFEGDVAFTNTTFAGPGLKLLTNTVHLAGTVRATNVTYSGGSLVPHLGESATIEGTLDWASGNIETWLTVAPGSRLNILGSASRAWTGSLVNHGRVVWEGSGNLSAGFYFYNQPDGVWEIRGDGTASSYNTGVFNTGLIVKSAGTGTTTLGPWQNGYGLQSSGTLRVESGTVKVVGAGHLFSGPTNIVFAESNTSLVFDGSVAFTNTTFGGPGLKLIANSVICAGTIRATNLTYSGGTASFLSYDAAVTLEGTLDWASGYMENTVLIVPAGSRLNITGQQHRRWVRCAIYNAGLVVWADSASFNFTDSQFYNQPGGVWDIRCDATISGYDCGFANEGLIMKSAGTGNTSFDPQRGPGFQNNGVLEIQQGIVSVSGNYAPGATSSLKIGLSGPIAGSDHGQLAVAGTATLAGQIQAAVTGGFTPSLGQEFTALTCASRVGTFANSTVDAGSGVTLSPDHRATSVVLVATIPPHLAVVPGSTTVVAGQTAQFAAANGTPTYTFTLATNNSGGSITTAGLYTAGGSAGVDTVRVTDSAGSNATASVTVVTCNSMLGLVAWWRGEDNPQDAIGSLHGTLNNGASYVAGRVGRGIAFDGVNDSMSVSDSPAWDFGGADLTIELWLKLNEVKSGIFVHQQSGAAAGGFEFFYSGGESALAFNANSSYRLITRPWSPAADTWYHVAVVRTQSVCRLYVNGAQLGADQSDGTSLANVTGPLLIGNWAGGVGYELNGVLDELSIYNRALAATELQAIYTAGSAGKCPPVPPLQLAPATTNAVSGAAVQFAATGGTPPYTFTLATNNSGGSITSAGLYTAGPGCGGTDTVRVADVAGSNVLALAIVTDATLPTINCPGDITAEATSPAGAVVSYGVTATDNCTAHPVLVSSPPSGGTFPIGTNLVTCSAMDAAGKMATCSFKIIVRDTTPPGVACPANISVTTDNPTGATVNFVVSAGDLADTGVGIVCTPASGSVFPPGTTTVNCVATDDAGNTSSCSFTVSVTVVPTTFAVSGRVAEANNSPVAGVAVTLTGRGVNTSTTTDASGNYQFSSVAPGSYVMTARDSNFTMTPTSDNVTVSTANATRDFSAVRTAVTISGRVTSCISGEGMAGVRIYATRARMQADTDSEGYYSLPGVPLQSEIIVFPSVSAGIAQPGSIRLVNPQSEVTANFCARRQLTVSGLVRDADGLGLDNVAVAVSGDVTTVLQTRAGRFNLRALQGQNLTFTPTTDTHLFMPVGQTFANLSGDISLAFTGVALPGFALPGRIAYGRFEFRRWGQYANQFFAHMMYLSDIGRAEPISGNAFRSNVPVYNVGHAWSRDGSTLFWQRRNQKLVYRAGSGLIGLTGLDAIISKPWSASPSPDGSQLACVDSDGALWIANTDGSSATKRVDSGVCGLASWSPDGSELAYPAGGTIVRIKAVQQAGDPPPLITLCPYTPIDSVAWSPDGRRFACNPGGSWPSFVMATNGGAPILELPGAGSLTWSPDGSRLAFARGWNNRLGYNRLFTIRVDGSGLRELFWRATGNDLSVVEPHSWAPYYNWRTEVGTLRTVGSAQAVAVTFANVTKDGGTTIQLIPANSVSLPAGYFSFGGSSGVQIETTAQTTGPITVCFRVPDDTSEAMFNRLRIFHGEDGVLVDRTILPPNYAQRTICAQVSSLSPFVIGEQIDTALPQITGVVVDTNGLPVVDAQVALFGDCEVESSTDLDGRFAFPNLSATGTYTVTVGKAGLGFTPAEMNLPALGTGADILFVGTNTPPRPVPRLVIAQDARFGNQPTLTWPGLLYEFQLESTDSLESPEWGIVPELQLPVDTGTVVPLAPTENQRYFRLRQP